MSVLHILLFMLGSMIKKKKKKKDQAYLGLCVSLETNKQVGKEMMMERRAG